MPTMYFKHTKTGKMFKVVGNREADGKAYLTLECKDGKFEELYTKQRFKDMGYTLVKKEETEDDED